MVLLHKEIVDIKNKIESLNKIHHIKIFQVLIENNIPYTENRNGVFINMNSFNKNIIEILRKTILYITTQEQTLNDIESIKNKLSNNFFNTKL
ncbi:MAG: hypothetical protein CL678_05575 [Bdellovibrionaceae bacterium]|nr:hypothetical protein [Pseudobdellovibrionaceae bacterium]|tara:strand:- start:53 stop:331 length:279 start_codon:yes stop_codon:yes gene_type:complete